MKPMGGSEILYLNLLKYVDVKWEDKVNLVLSHCSYDAISNNKINVVWQHLNSNEEIVQPLSDSNLIEKIDHFVFVSHWQYNKFKNIFQVPSHKSTIIKNAIDPIIYLPREKKNKLKIIYTSTPWRGLDVLLDVFEKLNRSDIELDIFSSAKIYGDNFVNLTKGMFDQLFERAKTMKNVNFYDYQPNDVVRYALTQAHIFAYPSVFEETSCLSAIEAAAAGCKIVTTNLGALSETVGDWASFVPLGFDRDILINDFAKELNYAIDNYWNQDVQENLKLQSIHFNRNWSWQARKKEWNKFFNKIIYE